MKLLISLAAGLCVVMIAALLLLQPAPVMSALQLDLASNPFPLAVGRATLLIRLTDDAGTPVDNALVEVSANMQDMGALPVGGSSRNSQDGLYEVTFTLPRSGQWIVDVSATLPDQATSVSEQFAVYVYSISPFISAEHIRYRSASEINALISDPAREKLIFIPIGTQTVMRGGHADDVIPTEIRLQLDGQNTLVIQNDDIADHTIGPFFVRSGETLRQTFYEPAVFQGTCSINDATQVSIIIE